MIAPLATIYLDNATGPKIRYINVEGFAYNSMYDSRSSLLDYLREDDPVYPAGRFYDDVVAYVGILGELRSARWVYVFSRYSPPSYCEVRSLEYADALAFYPWGDPRYKGAFYPYLVIDYTPFSPKETKALRASMSAADVRWAFLPGDTGKDYVTDDVAIVERASTVDVVFTSIPLLYVATERAQHISSLDFGLPIVVRLSASTSSAAVTYLLTRGL